MVKAARVQEAKLGMTKRVLIELSRVVPECITEVKLHTALATLYQVPESDYVCLRR